MSYCNTRKRGKLSQYTEVSMALIFLMSISFLEYFHEFQMFSIHGITSRKADITIDLRKNCYHQFRDLSVLFAWLLVTSLDLVFA